MCCVSRFRGKYNDNDEEVETEAKKISRKKWWSNALDVDFDVISLQKYFSYYNNTDFRLRFIRSVRGSFLVKPKVTQMFRWAFFGGRF